MKSLFKRTVAAASSSVLVLSQFATLAANVNVNAAETAPLTIDKKFVLDVPVDEADPLKADQCSNWSDKAESMLLAVGEKTVTVNTAKAKNTARKYANKAAAKVGHISSAQIDEVLAAISDTATVELDGKGGFKATLDCANVGKTIGQIAEDEFLKMDYELDWSNFKACGSLIAEGQIDYAKKTVAYEVYIIDETGAVRKGDKEIEAYANKKLDEIVKTVSDQADAIAADAVAKNGNKSEDNSAEIAKKKQETIDGLANARKKCGNALSLVREVADAVVAINVSGTDVNTVYTDYVAAVEKAASANSKMAKYVAKADAKLPETVEAALTNEKANDYYDIVVENANTILDGKAVINFTTADALAILNEGYDFDIQIKDGPSGSITFKIADDQADELLAAVLALGKDPKEYADAGYTVVLEDGSVPTFSDEYEYTYKEIVSEKKISATALTEYGVKGKVSYDVNRIINKIVLTQTKKTTTTTKPTTTTTTSTTPAAESETTPADETKTTPADETKTTPADETKTTPASETKTTPASETETTPASETETTPTYDTGTTPADETKTTPADETKTTPAGGSETTTITTTTATVTETEPKPETSTTPATFVSFEIKGIEDQGLVYWSEEKGTFDLSKLSVTLRFFEEGKEVGTAVDVTDAFAPDATSPKDMTLADGLGMAAVPVSFVLKDTEKVQKAVLDAGYDQALIDQEGLKEGLQAGKFTVILVLRGDSDLNGEIDVIDAQYALVYYTDTMLAQFSAKHVLDNEDAFLKKNYGDKREAYFPYSHYAMDVTCESQNRQKEVVYNDGMVTVEDAQMILSYYTEFVVGEKDNPSWDNEEVVGVEMNVLDELHAAPCALDQYAAEYAVLDRTIVE